MSLRTDSDRFLLDGMLGVLARKLRMLGLDAEFSADADPAMIRYRSRAEARIVLTRNPKLVKILGDRGWLVTGTDAREEFQSLVPLLRMITPPRDPFSRCLDCNTRLVSATREQARDSVPYYVWKNTEHFMTCSSCDKNYWKGTHHRRMLEEVREMEEELKQE
jgi:uncharacterized protein with PIN domain